MWRPFRGIHLTVIPNVPILQSERSPRRTPNLLLPNMPSEAPTPEPAMQSDIDRLKNPASYKEQFESTEVQELSQAIDILARLRMSTHDDASRVGWEKLEHARKYLDELLKMQFSEPENEN